MRSPLGSSKRDPRGVLAPVAVRGDDQRRGDPLDDRVGVLQPLGDEERGERGRREQRERRRARAAGCGPASRRARPRRAGSARRSAPRSTRTRPGRSDGARRSRSGSCRRVPRPAQADRRARTASRAASTRRWCSSSDSPPGKRKPGPPRFQAAHASGSLASISSSDAALPARRGATRPAGRRPAARRRSPHPRSARSPRARASWLVQIAAMPMPADPLGQLARLLAAAFVQRRVDPALHDPTGVVVRLTVAGEVDHFASVEQLQGVGAQAEPQRLQRDHVLGQHVAQVHVGPEMLDEPDLLVLLRRLEDQLARCRSRGRSRRSGRCAPRRPGGTCRRHRWRGPRRSPGRRRR